MIEFDVDMSYLLECDELDKVVLNDENGEHEPMEFVPKDAETVGAQGGAIDMDWVRDLVERHSDHIEGGGRTFHNGAYERMAEEIAATVGERNPDGLPIGLTISNDGNLLNWMGENYVRQDSATAGVRTCKLVDNDSGPDMHCTACGRGVDDEYRYFMDSWGYSRCPHCGAQIIEEETE